MSLSLLCALFCTPEECSSRGRHLPALPEVTVPVSRALTHLSAGFSKLPGPLWCALELCHITACSRRITMDRNAKTTGLSRRTFLTTMSAAVVGAALGSLVPQSEGAQRHPKRGGVR